MLVVVPFVDGMLHPATARALTSWRGRKQFHQLDRDDKGAYGRLVRSLWGRQETFTIVEQDVAPSVGQLAELASCPMPWCTFLEDSGLYPDGPMFSLVKFSAFLQRQHPHAADDALITGARRDGEAGWWEVDRLMARNMEIRRVVWCCHDGRVRHLHLGSATVPPGA